MFSTLISKLQSSRYLPGDFQSNKGCICNGPPALITDGTHPVVLTGISVSLTLIIASLATFIAASIMACIMLFPDDSMSSLF